MVNISPFERYASEYDEWYEKYPAVFESEAEALRDMLPPGNSFGLEIGVATGRFSTALGIKEGIEPSEAMRRIAAGKGIEVMEATAEKLPYKDMHFDFVLMPTCIVHIQQLKPAFTEANRVLKKGGSYIIGLIEKNGIIGRTYEAQRNKSTFYKQAVFYTIDKVIDELKSTGFHDLEFSQTLSDKIDNINEIEPARPGYGEGSYIVIKAIKK